MPDLSLPRIAVPEAIAGLARTMADQASAPLLPMQARGLSFEVDDKRLVDEVDLSLGAKRLTVVMGPNGAGKSLLLKLLHGLITPSSGTLSWGGVPMNEAIRARQAMVFQRPVLLRRSVAANIDFALRLRGRGDAARRGMLLELVGLGDRARQPARLLSVGEQQRLALARGLAVGPEILFLDEPTASLDPASAQMIETIVKAEHERGTKIVLITHDIGQARRLADEVVFMNKGRLCEHTPAERFFTSPASAEAEAYLEGRIVL